MRDTTKQAIAALRMLIGVAAICASVLYAVRLLPPQVCRTFPPERWVRVTDATTHKTALVNMANQAIVVRSEITQDGKKLPISRVFTGDMVAGPDGPVYGWFNVTETPEQLVLP